MSVGAVQQLVDDLAARLHRSVVIDDPEVRLLYASRHYGDDDEARRRAVLEHDAGARTIGYVLAHGVATWTTAGIIPASAEFGLQTRVCVPIRWRGTLLGLLMVVDREGTLTTAEMSLLTEACQELATLMFGDHAPEVDDDAQALSDALDDLVASEPALRRAAVRTLTARLGEHGDRHVRALQLNAYEGRVPSSPGHISAGLRHALASEAPRHGAWTRLTAVHERSALVLLSSRTEIRTETVTAYAGDLVARVHDVAAGRFRCVAGMGGSAVGLEQARASFRQAELAARAGRDLLSQPVVAWANLGELAVLLQLPLAQLEEDCLPEEVQRLVASDKDGRSIETVQAFLDHAGSAPETADALHLHRTAVYYRLERIREATGLDLDDGRTRLALHLGLRLRELLRLQHH
ncbi:PucR family transcriptional regulator [Pedococcus sp. 5OH_020]|uniref:PucR family transcriptional regulator n=1 Tax=Pedococcus sp. 5OH_020 TaxID=2989814 RepID=UPI0022E9AD55|nr:helix-turn-helix domain-containing protein [Pedococcus sp. 5OH_020]